MLVLPLHSVKLRPFAGIAVIFVPPIPTSLVTCEIFLQPTCSVMDYDFTTVIITNLRIFYLQCFKWFHAALNSIFLVFKRSYFINKV